MPDHTSSLRRYLAPLVASAVVLVGAAGLCVFGLAAVTENYDGFVSWFNPFAAASCCGSVILVLLVSVAWWLFIDNRRRGQQHDQDRPKG